MEPTAAARAWGATAEMEPGPVAMGATEVTEAMQATADQAEQVRTQAGTVETEAWAGTAELDSAATAEMAAAAD
jgi:hypothetical protein